jgi:hypothetical protein
VTKLRGSTVDTVRDELAYAGGVAAWVEDNGAAPATYSLIVDGDRGATSVQALYEGDNVDLGNLYGDGDLLLYNTWGWRRNAGRLTRTNGALWRIDDSKRKLVVRGSDALDLVDVDSDRIAVLRPDGTLALLDARGRRLDSFRIGAAGVNAVRLTDSDAVVQRATAIEVWNLRSHRRVRRYPISEALGGNLADSRPPIRDLWRRDRAPPASALRRREPGDQPPRRRRTRERRLRWKRLLLRLQHGRHATRPRQVRPTLTA